MYVFAGLLLLNFVSFVHSRLEVEDNYTAASSSSLFPLIQNFCPSPHWCPISYLLFILWLRLYDCLQHEHLQNMPYSFIIILSSSLDILGQITLLAAFPARFFYLGLMRCCMMSVGCVLESEEFLLYEDEPAAFA